MAKYTPMMEQYLQVKAQVPDAFLFFRLGDFYEMFFEDAIRASQELEITLTGRDAGGDERVPMCGVPYHSAEGYVQRLIEKGYKVAICEQVEDPSAAKGVVRREIVRIVTPGTVMEGKAVADRRNNFIAALTEREGEIGLAVCDITTGELYAARTQDWERLPDELNVFEPSELLGEAGLLERVKAACGPLLAGAVVTERRNGNREAVAEQFSEAELEGLPESAIDAVALLLDYLRETQKRTLGHLTRIRRYDPRQSLMMDPFTRRNLELTETVRDRSKKGSLLWLLDRTATAMGARMLRRWLDKPLRDVQAIEERLEAVEKLVGGLILRDELSAALRGMYDLERLVGRIAYGSANGRDLVALRATLEQVPALKALCLESGSETLARLGEALDECAEAREWIAAAIVDEPPVSVREGGLIRVGYHEHLDRLRAASTDGKRWIAELEQREREATGIRSLKIGFNKVFGYYIEVTRANLSAVPEGRYERKQTLANGERYVTPELKEREALILEAEDKMVGLEYELFVELRDRLAGMIPRFQALAEAVAQVDALLSMAQVSAANRYVRPKVTDGFELRIEDGRHPVVEAVLEGGSFIANDTDMNASDSSVLLITGPNMAGKSTYMRQVAMICVMAQIGCFVPARRAEIPIIDRIFTRIGAADDLVGGQSTFMVEMKDIQAMTTKATKHSLVIIDELGRGTSTSEGMAIAQAVIEFLHDRIGCKTLVSTHYHELAHLEGQLPRLRNHSMAVRESGDQVTFLRKFVRGAASSSYGIYCARIAGLPSAIIERANELLAIRETGAARAEAAAASGLIADGRSPDGREQEASSGGAAAAEKEAEPASPVAPPDVSASPEEASPARKDVVQLSLFDEPLPSPAKPRSARDQQVLDKLKAADLINMTPLQAMNLLYELKQRLG
ncbi:DNA mismatch repair protein MutS [Paenibacillus thermoaerophilus]|uniref:DNA mismatch repair protein MutS n=1 Tax=Paenibacillus thermoaerophilus TaxID=1215385 RepID=A0ABW2V3U3_9BACL|nr:DNA mismatch repair protein MutS [Paenibacillus thermoaerophilus]TMV17198.1 DNA mismatch repair protein MutS [Paenibacillus thermoaerophilus]